MKKLTEIEMRDKGAHVLCFWCYGKWLLNHNCINKELSILLVVEDENLEEVVEEGNKV